MKKIAWIIVSLLIIVGVYNTIKPLPEGVRYASDVYHVPASSIQFYSDTTYVDKEGERYSEQEIFDEIFSMIRGAQHYILLDIFLFNDLLGTATTSYRQLSQELTDILIEKKKTHPAITIVFITDPINEIYGGMESKQITALKNAGVEIIISELGPLRDSNPIYGALWRTFFVWFGNGTQEGVMPNPFDVRAQKLSVRSYLSLFNFKANHRKVIMADKESGEGIKFSVLVTSANPHDGSSAHTNTAIQVEDFMWRDVIITEKIVADFSNTTFTEPSQELRDTIIDTTGGVAIQLLTEGVIRGKIVVLLDQLERGDTFDMSMFYLSERKIIRAIKRASSRGVAMRILLDPNKDAFGRTKNGIPNRSVARELVRSSDGEIKIRWCHTHGEQCHTKLLLLRHGESFSMIQGSANLTRRNISDYNLETNILVESDSPLVAIDDAYRYFNTVWENEPNRIYSIEYDFYKDESFWKVVVYHLMERLGLSSF